ncbi:MAG: hypothetical protein RI558_02890 [Psychroflexus sp.]|nr:hypothetical protein [Psychroflexus sp.]
MRKAAILLIVSLTLISCLFETPYTLTPVKEAVIIEDLKGIFHEPSDSTKVKISIDENIYTFHFFNSKDSLESKHSGFISDLNGVKFLNFDGRNQLKNTNAEPQYQYYKVTQINRDQFKFNPVVDSLFKDKQFKHAQEFRKYFKSQLDQPALINTDKNEIILNKIN